MWIWIQKSLISGYNCVKILGISVRQNQKMIAVPQILTILLDIGSEKVHHPVYNFMHFSET